MSHTTAFRTLAFAMAIGGFISLTALETKAQEDQQAPPPAPTNLTVSALKKGVKLTWSNVNAPAVNEFIVYRLENYSPDKTLRPIASVPHDARTPKMVTYIDNTTDFSHTYTYFVTAKTRFGVQSANSKMLPVTTPTPHDANILSR